MQKEEKDYLRFYHLSHTQCSLLGLLPVSLVFRAHTLLHGCHEAKSAASTA